VETEVASRRAGARNTWNQIHELLQVAALQRQLVYGLGLDRGRKIGGCSLQCWGFGRHLHRLEGGPQLQLSVRSNHLSSGKLNLGDIKWRKTLGQEVGPVLTRHEIRQTIIARAVGLGGDDDAGFDVRDRYFNVGYNCSLWISNEALNNR